QVIEHAVRAHPRGVGGAKEELDVAWLADLHTDHVPPAGHLAEVKRVADRKVYVIRAEEGRRARRVAAVVGVEPGSERVSCGRVWDCRLTVQRSWRQAKCQSECQV